MYKKLTFVFMISRNLFISECVFFCIYLHIILEHPAISQPTYVNMSELASMAAYKNTNNIITSNPTTSTTPPVSIPQQPNSPVLSTTSSLVSPDSSATNPISSPDVQTPQNTPQTNSPLTTVTSTNNNNDDDKEKHHSTSTTPTNQNAPVNNSNNNTTSSLSTLDNNISIIETITTTMSTMSIIAASTSVAELTKCESPLIDTKSSGSVLDKASMFEKKLEEQQTQINATAATQQQSSHHPISLINSTLNLTPATVARLESIYGKKTEEIYNKTAGLLEKVDTGQLFPSIHLYLIS